MTRIDQSDIRKLLPHRYPFLLVDKIIQLEINQSIVGIKNVTANEPFFSGHFPQRPIMPGVLMIEALAQVAGILIKRTHTHLSGFTELFYLAGVNEVRFKRLVEPGDQLKLEVDLVKSRLNLWKFQGLASVENEVACSAEFMIVKAPAEE